jgi:Fe-S-cluster containining protein
MTESASAFPDHECPRLRADLVFEPVEDEPFVAWLVDQRQKRRIRMEGVGLAICRLIDGSRTPDEILRHLEREGSILRRSLLDQTLTFFVEQGLLVGREDDRSDTPRIGRVALRAASSELREFGTITVLDEARHNCVGCGACCRGYNFGPLKKEEVLRISEMTFLEDRARLARSERATEYDYNGQMVPTLARREDGRCTFLAEDNRCIIYREHGADAKPWFCQAFPLHFVVSPDGSVSGYLQMECFGFHEASTHGPHLKDRENEVARMLSLVPHVPSLDDHVAVGDGRKLTFEE